MPIEINELVIRTAVADSGTSASAASANTSDASAQEQVSAVARKAAEAVLRQLKRKNER